MLMVALLEYRHCVCGHLLEYKQRCVIKDKMKIFTSEILVVECVILFAF